jgi:hypothetical protein
LSGYEPGEVEVKLTITNDPPPSVRAMTEHLLAAGWTRTTPRPKEPWYWCDPLRLNDYKMRVTEAYQTQLKREDNGVVERPDVHRLRHKKRPKMNPLRQSAPGKE